MEIVLENYHLGMIVGAIITFSFMSLFQGAEVLLFGGLLLEWTARRAYMSIGAGIMFFAIGVVFHRWIKSIKHIEQVSTVED